MSARVPTEDELEAEAIADNEDLLDYPRRGRPKLPPEQRRRSKLVLSFTGEEMTRLIVTAAGTKDEKGRPMKTQDWARDILLAAAPEKEPKKED